MDANFNKKLDEAIKTGKFDQIKCNNDEERSLLEAGKKIYQAKFKAIPADNSFKNVLFDRLKQARQGERKTMEKEMVKGQQFDWLAFLTQKKWAVGIASFLLVAIVASLLYWLPGTDQTTGGILIPRAQADEMFTFKPTKADSIGIDEESDFSLVSKIDLKLADVEKYLEVEPNFKYSVKEISAREFLIDSQEKLNRKQVYKFKLKTTTQDADVLESRDFDWAYQIKDEFRITGTIPGDKSDAVPLDSGIEINFNQENFVNFEQAIEIIPTVPGRLEKHYKTLVFVPTQNLQASTWYQVKVSKSIALDGSDKKLTEDYTFAFETSTDTTKDGYFEIEDEVGQYGPEEVPGVKMWVNIFDSDENKNVATRLFRLESQDQFLDLLNKRNEIPLWASQARNRAQVDVAGLNKVGEYDLPIHRLDYNQYILFPDKLPIGYYLAQFTVKGQTRQSFIQISNLTAYTSISKTNSLVRIYSLAGQKPAAETILTLYQGELEERTNNEGIAFFATPEVLLTTSEKSRFLLATGADGALVIPIKNYERGRIFDTDTSENDNFWRYVFLDRSVYHPTDTIKFWGMIKPRDANTAKVNKVSVGVEMFYPQTDVFGTVEVDLNKDGVFSGEYQLKNMPTSSLNFTIRGENDELLLTQYLNIEDYIKPAYRIELLPDKKAVVQGETVNVLVKARYFDGTPVANLDLDYQGSTIKTDQVGETNFTVETTDKANCSDYNCWSSSSTIEVRPLRAEEGEIVGATSVDVFPAKEMVKISGKYDEENGQIAWKINVNEVGFERLNLGEKNYYDDYIGQKLPNHEIQVQIYETWWERTETGEEEYDFINKVTRKKYSYSREEKLIKEFGEKTDENGEYDYVLKDLTAGKDYTMRASIVDPDGRQYFNRATIYFDGGNNSSISIDSYGFRRDENEDVKTFKLGEKVNLTMVKNSFESMPDKTGSYIFYQAQNGITEYQVGDSSKYEFTFEEKHIPNISVVGVYFDGARFYHTKKVWNDMTIFFDYEQRRLQLEVKAEKEQYEPGDEATIKIEVKDENGQPIEANGNISLVDEAYFDLFNREPVDTLALLYSKVEDGIFFSETSNKPLAKMIFQGGCFTAGTKILMADGTTKAIEDIRLGDLVSTFVNEHSNIKMTDKVTKIFNEISGGYLVINDQLNVTSHHRLLVNNKWMMAGEIKVGDYLRGQDGELVEVKKIETKSGRFTVYNFTTEATHTYIADGVYVHNSKGGGRESFEDTAFFSSWKTDRNGKATVKFTLPDNITSWRITTQGISSTLRAGSGTNKLVVTQPVFLDMSLNTSYVNTDKPIVPIRVYGENLTANDDVEITVESKTLKTKEKLDGKAFTTIEWSMPELKVGEQEIIVTAKAKGLTDSVKRSFVVNDTRLTKQMSQSVKLAVDLKPKQQSENGRVEWKFFNGDIGWAYENLLNASWQDGERIDQKLAPVVAEKYLHESFGLGSGAQQVDDIAKYQREDGGWSLLPYSDSDLKLSALTAGIVPTEWQNVTEAKKYFNNILENKKSNTAEIAMALYGLTNLDEPVLNQVNQILKWPELKPIDQIYLGLAAEKSGAKELGRNILQNVLQKNVRTSGDNMFIPQSDQSAQDEITSLAAILANATDMEEKENLMNYLHERRDSENLYLLENMIITKNILSKDKNLNSEFTYTVAGKSKKISLKNNEEFALSLTNDENGTMTFSQIKGKITAVANWEEKAIDTKTDKNLKISREYWVNDQKVDAIRENDLVEVRIFPQISEEAPSDAYQITDLLPSGLKPITRTYTPYWGSDGGNWKCNVYFPSDINGQKLSFIVYKNLMHSGCEGGYISYFARVSNKGDFTREPVTINQVDEPTFRLTSQEDKRLVIE